VFHLGFWANTRAAARQMVGHGHVTVNGRKASIPSYALKSHDVISVKEQQRFRASSPPELGSRRQAASVPDWFVQKRKSSRATVMRFPTRQEIQPIANEQAVVEFYSR